jgi:hypothetical protein
VSTSREGEQDQATATHWAVAPVSGAKSVGRLDIAAVAAIPEGWQAVSGPAG